MYVKFTLKIGSFFFFQGYTESESELLSHVRLFSIPWTVACTRLLRPWDFLGKSTEVGCRFFLQGIFPTQRSNRGLKIN